MTSPALIANTNARTRCVMKVSLWGRATGPGRAAILGANPRQRKAVTFAARRGNRTRRTPMVRQTVRRLRRSPTLTLTALLTLAIGIGASAAMFSVINAVLLRPLPYPDSERLVALIHRFEAGGRGGLPASPALYFTYREHNRTFESVALWASGTASVTGSVPPEEVKVLRATVEFLPTLRVVPALGRAFTAAEDQPGGPRTVIVSHGYWQHRFGGAPVIGQPLVVDGQPHTVVGVLPESFRFARAADLVLPLQPRRDVAYVGP